MPWTKCENCKKEAFINPETDNCPNCHTLAGAQSENISLKSDPKITLVNQAISQANILNKFGEVMQIIGYVVMGINALGFVIAFFTSEWILLGFFLVSIPLTFAYFNVFGSAFRAIGLYIQIRVK
jgi:hypothetical protein